MTGFDFLDQEVGLEYCAGDEEIYREILEGYLEEDRREELKKSFDAEDLATYRVNAHAIKSTSLTIGATELSAKAKALEYAAADGDGGQQRRDHVHRRAPRVQRDHRHRTDRRHRRDHCEIQRDKRRRRE